jgi:hypothetical protein
VTTLYERLVTSSLAMISCCVLALSGCGGKEPDTDLDKRLEDLRAVPYTQVSRSEARTDASGVVVHKRERVWPGYNIYCGMATPEVFLMDMDGNVVHRWAYVEDETGPWHHAILQADGSIVLINMYKYVLKLDWHSRPLWKREMYAHHDIVELADGTFYVIGFEVWMHRGLAVRFPTIMHLTSEGEEISRWSAHEALDHLKATFDTRSFLDTILDSMLSCDSWLEVYNRIAERHEVIESDLPGLQYDHFHMNTVTVLPDTPLGRRDKRFRAGNLLTCFRNVNQIAVLDQETMEVLWVWGEGVLEWPHHPTMLDNGHLLIFDNGFKRKYSRVIELDPVGEVFEWQYKGDPPESFYSSKNGSAQRLPNGNTLICDGDQGRAIEVTPGGEIVWEWLNPLMKGKRRVTVYRMMRLPPETVEPLLESAGQKR